MVGTDVKRALALASLPIALAVLAAWAFTVATAAPEHPTNSVHIGDTWVRLEFATTTSARELGLGNRAALAPGTGMLFVFPRDGFYAFWMKDMRFAIDIVWLDASGRVVTIRDAVSPGTYPASFSPASPVRFVLELPAGFAAAHGVRVGDSLALPEGALGQSQ